MLLNTRERGAAPNGTQAPDGHISQVNSAPMTCKKCAGKNKNYSPLTGFKRLLLVSKT